MQNNEIKLIFDERGYLQPASSITVNLYGNPLQSIVEWGENQPFMNEYRQEIWQ